jgi:hypothetical protein
MHAFVTPAVATFASGGFNKEFSRDIAIGSFHDVRLF